MKRSVFRVSTVIDKIFRRMMRRADLNELLVGSVRLAKVSTESALAFTNVFHRVPPMRFL
jgi:hypothetical protein